MAGQYSGSLKDMNSKRTLDAIFKIMKVKKFLLIIPFLTILAALLVIFQPKLTQPATQTQTSTEKIFSQLQDSSTTNLKFREITLNLEVAKSESSRQRGLMERTNIPENSGMLFIFEDESPRVFWMKNTPSSLDIIFLDRDLRVVRIHENTKPNQTSETYSSEKPAKFAVEMNGGWSQKNSLKVGDQLEVIE